MRLTFSALAMVLALPVTTRAQVVERVSLASGGQQSQGASTGGALSANGRFVLFDSDAPNLVPGDTNSRRDVFLRDRQAGTTVRISVGNTGAESNGHSRAAGVSADGTVIVFLSEASNLTASGSPGLRHVYVRDLVAGTTTRLSSGSNGSYTTDHATVSPDGRFVAWSWREQGPAPPSGARWHDRQTGQQGTITAGQECPPGSFTARRPAAPQMSADGNLAIIEGPLGDCGTFAETSGGIFLWNRSSGTSVLLSVDADGSPLNGYCEMPALSSDGKVAAFTCAEGTLGTGVFVRDLTTSQTTKVDGSNRARSPSLSAGGRHLAYASGFGDESDVIVVDLQTGYPTMVSRHLSGRTGYRGSFGPVISGDGRVVMFTSAASNLVSGDTNGADDVFVAVDGGLPCTNVLTPNKLVFPALGASADLLGFIGVATWWDCRWAAVTATSWVTKLRLEAALGSTIKEKSGPGGVWFELEQNPGSPRTGSIAVAGAPLTISQLGTGAPQIDTDGDGLPDEWETRFGLNPFSAVGDDGPDGDPDGDGKTNLEELVAGTHPRGFHTRYLAEGATGHFWHTRVALANPAGTKALALLRFLRAAGGPITLALEVPPMGRRTVDPGADPALANQALSTIVESDVLLVVDRTMQWDVRGYGSHAETSIAAPAPTWYLAEGHTQPFDLFYLIQNPNPTSVRVEVTYLRPAPAPPLVRTYEVAAESRFNIYVNWIFELEGSAVSAVLRALDEGGIIVERAMYLGDGARAGHASAGVTAPATQWFLAEGATGFFFDFFILLANPTDTDTVVDARFLRDDGLVVETAHPLPAQSRANIYVNDLHPLLADAAVSTVLTSRQNIPIIVERAMYWDRRGLAYEAHNSPGATQTGTRWALADGEAGTGTDTYILVANTSAFAGRIKLTLLFEDGGTAEREFDVLANSRLTVYPPQHFPEANGRRFGAVIESLGAQPAQIVVERAMYSSTGGVFWEAGSNVLGTRLP
jgi:Tol biopolymer transport system component